jgi:hypothetical protein
MSEVIQFWKSIDSNPEQRKKFSALGTNSEIVVFAKSLGYNFSLDEYEKEVASSLNLDQISGGLSADSGPAQCPTTWPTVAIVE